MSPVPEPALGPTETEVMDEPIQPRPDYQQRVIEEKAELDGKIARLLAFRTTTLFLDQPKEEQDRLNQQAYFMTRYSDVLGQRIAAF